MATRRPSYPVTNQAVTITLASLATNTVVWSSVIDNTTNLYDDILIQGKFKTAASAVSALGYLNVRLAASADGGITYDASVTNTDVIACISANVISTTYYLPVRSIAALFGGLLPPYIKIGIENQTGAALTGTSTDHGVWFAAEQETLV